LEQDGRDARCDIHPVATRRLGAVARDVGACNHRLDLGVVGIDACNADADRHPQRLRPGRVSSDRRDAIVPGLDDHPLRSANAAI